MRILLSALAITLAGTCLAGANAGGLSPEVAERLQQSVVRLEFEENTGSGFLISSGGLILTAAHVVPEGVEQTLVHFTHGGKAAARFLGYCPTGTDLAALQIDDRAFRPSLSLANPRHLQIGMPVFTAGSPYPLYPAIVGSGILGFHRESHGIALYTAPVSNGSSGGPLVNGQGEVLGVVSSQLLDETDTSIYASGFNTAIDAASIARFLEQIEAGNLSHRRIAHLEFLRMPLPRLTPGQRTSAELTSASDQLPNDLEYAQGYLLELEEETIYQLFLSSEAFDSYLMVYDNEAELIAENDDANEHTTDAGIYLNPPHSGRYVAVATTLERGETGPYTIELTPLKKKQILRHEGVLLPGSSGRDSDGHLHYDFPMPPLSGTIIAEMQSGEFDCFLELLDEEGTIIDSNDDAAGNDSNSRLVITLSPEKTLRLRATTYEAEESGSFTLTVYELRPARQ